MQKTQRKWNEENFDYLGNGRKTEMIKLVDGDEEDEERKKVFVHNWLKFSICCFLRNNSSWQDTPINDG